MLPDHSAREAGPGCDIASAWFLAQVRWRPVCDDQIFGTLARLETTQPHVERTAIAALIKTQVSPWLERTCWLHYLKGLPLDKAAGLARLTIPHDKPVFYEISLAVDRLVEAAHLSLCEEKVNFFGQKRITSFLPDREVYSRPLVYKLHEATYKQSKQSWIGLLHSSAEQAIQDSR
jgi:hypothetical protein